MAWKRGKCENHTKKVTKKKHKNKIGPEIRENNLFEAKQAK